MPFSIDDNMMREIIIDHSKSPNNKKIPQDLTGFLQIRANSASCIDDITVYLKVENGVVLECTFEGVACAISTSSTDIMCDLVRNKTLVECFEILDNYFKMIYEEEYDEDILEEANAFKNTHKQAARIKCATIGWNALKTLLEQSKGE